MIELPPDIWDLIIEALADEVNVVGNWDPSSLMNMALTCKAMLSPCRRLLFSSIDLTDPSPDGLFHRIDNLYELISHNPSILQYFRSLTIFLRHSDHVRLPQIFEILCRSPNLQSIVLWGNRWDKLSRPLQIALENIIQLPTLNQLTLSLMWSFPASILLGSSITGLSLLCTNVTHSGEEGCVLRPTAKRAAKLTYLAADGYSFDGVRSLMNSPGGGGSIVDFSSLRQLLLEEGHDPQGLGISVRTLRSILETSKAMESLDITAMSQSRNAAISWAGFGTSLTVGSTPDTLEKLNLGVCVGSEGASIISDVFSELGMMAGKNVLQEIRLKIHFDTGSTHAVPRSDADEWSALDSLLTRPGSFPMLRLVTLTIWWGSSDPENAKDIAESSFPNLLTSSVVKFQFTPNCYRLRPGSE